MFILYRVKNVGICLRFTPVAFFIESTLKNRHDGISPH